MPPMRPLLTALVLSLALVSCRGSSGSGDGADRGFVMAELTPSQGDLKAVLKAEAAKAKAQGLKPHVELWATWCGPCKAMKQSLDDPRMKAAFKGTYIVQLDVDLWGPQKLSSAGLDSKVIPVFYGLDEEGKPTGKTISGGAWKEDVPDNMAPPLDKYFHGG